MSIAEGLSEAERLLWGYGVTNPDDIDLDAIAFDQDADVRYRPMDGCEARLLANGEKAVISVNTGSIPTRQRFSLAHELAHWMCDRRRGAFLCAAEDIGPQNAEAKSLESSANAYASQLVLPDYLVDPRIKGKTITLDTAAKIASEFKTSLTASAIKTVKRAQKPAWLFCHSQGKREWFLKNRTVPEDAYPARELHHETDAFSLVFGAAGGMSRPRREPAGRWFLGSSARNQEVWSQSVKISGDCALTIISFV